MSALDRLLPLRYIDPRLDGGLRDLTRLRGVSLLGRDYVGRISRARSFCDA